MARWYGAALTTGATVEQVASWPKRVSVVTADEVREAARAWLDKTPLGHRLSGQGTARPGEALVKASSRSGRRPRIRAVLAATMSFAVSIAAALLLAPRRRTTIERVVSPGGIEAWLVQEPTVPLVALDFAFRGGASQDPADKPGVANMATSLLDEGAGDLDSKAFHERLEAKAIELGFSANRDQTSGSVRTLSAISTRPSSCCGSR